MKKNIEYFGLGIITHRVSSKQSNFFFGLKRNKPKLNLFRLFFGLFCETKKHFFWVCFGVSDRYQNNRNKQNFVETNQNNLKKTLIFFSWFEPKQTETQSVSVVFCFFFAKPKKIFLFVSVFRTGFKTTQTNRTYGMGN
jgi:hypothetical protein